MAIVGYARVSSVDQDHTTQMERLKAVGCTRVFSEKKSGTSKQGRNALDECLQWMREGDTLAVTKIDRLARSARDLHNMLHELEEREISLMVLASRPPRNTTLSIFPRIVSACLS